MTAEFNSATELMPLPAAQPETETHTAEEHRLPRWAEAGEQQLADEDEAETQNLPKWANAAGSQPQVESLGGGVFSIEGLMGNQPAPTLSALDRYARAPAKKNYIKPIQRLPPAMCRWKKLTTTKSKLVLKCLRAKQQFCQLKVLMQLVARQLPK